MRHCTRYLPTLRRRLTAGSRCQRGPRAPDRRCRRPFGPPRSMSAVARRRRRRCTAANVSRPTAKHEQLSRAEQHAAKIAQPCHTFNYTVNISHENIWAPRFTFAVPHSLKDALLLSVYSISYMFMTSSCLQSNVHIMCTKK